MLSLRYSLVPETKCFIKYIERWGINVNGTVDFGRKVSCTVSRNGDLIHKVYLQATVGAMDAGSDNSNWVQNLGHNLIDEVSIEIGGQTIDKHYGLWLTIWNELTQTSEKTDGYNNMIANVSSMTTSNATAKPEYTMYIPLQFWFCRNPGLALPLIALQYHEVKFNITFKALSDLYETNGTLTVTPTLQASLYVDYIYLDTDERRQFAQVQHEYLIEQLQYTGAESISAAGSYKSKLALNHPCKELVWVIRDSGKAGSLSGTDYIDVTSAKLQLNGQDRFSERRGDYFNLVQPYQHHTRIPSDGIYVYSFALNPEQHQPSGTVNMSRIDNATLQLVAANSGNLHVFATNYNVLRIMAGIKECFYYINLCQTVSCIISSTITYYEKQCKIVENEIFLYNWLVNRESNSRFATTSNCGNILRA